MLLLLVIFKGPHPTGRVELLELLDQVEQEGVWPAQLLGTICALLPKPKGGGRVIGPLAESAKIWSRLRYGAASEWTERWRRTGTRPLQAAAPYAPLF
eukprot:171439-Pyramimonas_sp.AAC.1